MDTLGFNWTFCKKECREVRGDDGMREILEKELSYTKQHRLGFAGSDFRICFVWIGFF